MINFCKKVSVRSVFIFLSLLAFSFFHAQKKKARFINVNTKGILPTISASETDEQKHARYTQILDLFNYARKNKINMFFPAGTYDVGARNFPFRTLESIKTDQLLDGGNIVVYGEKGTVFKTTSNDGADVLQLNKIKNITFRNLDITATLLAFNKSGSNGISITNGFDNITLENIHIYNLPGTAQGTWIDGAKALTIQADVGSTSYMGSVTAKNISAENVGYGFRMDTGHVSDVMKNFKTIKIDIDMSVKKAFQGFSLEFGKSLNDIPPNDKLNIKINAKLIDCQQYVRFARLIGGSYNFIFENTQPYDQKSVDYAGNKWLQESDGIFGFLSYYTKNAKVTINGNVGDVDNKIWIGAVGSIVEPYNLGNRTERNIFNFNIEGVARNEEIRIIEYDGESLNNNIINITTKTAKEIPEKLRRNNNVLRIKS